MKDETMRDGILAYIIQYKRSHDGIAPTVREIADAFDIRHISVVHYHLVELDRTGRIKLGEKSSSRNISIPGGEWVYRG